MPSYYDKVLEDFESEGIFDNESSDEGSDKVFGTNLAGALPTSFPALLTDVPILEEIFQITLHKDKETW